MREVAAVLLGAAAVLAAPGLSTGEGPEPSGNIGLSVSPGGLAIQHVVPGQTYDLAERSGVILRVSNQDTKPRTYRLSANKPSAVGNRTWLPGYLEIPDPSWFWFEQEELTVPAGGEGAVKMYLKIPEGPQYGNQHWTVSIGVQGVSQPGEALALAAYPRYQIETEPAQDIGVTPDGLLGLEPSAVGFEGLRPGSAGEVRLMLHNNEPARSRYTLSAKVVAVDPSREQIAPSPGYLWLPDPAWLSVEPRHLAIAEQGHRAVRVTIRVPDAPEHYSKAWEALVWIEPDKGPPRFARVQIDTAPSPVTQ